MATGDEIIGYLRHHAILEIEDKKEILKNMNFNNCSELKLFGTILMKNVIKLEDFIISNTEEKN